MICQARPSDGPMVVPIINIVFEEMELPILQSIPNQKLFQLLEKAFEIPEYRYSYAHTLVYEQNGEILGIAVGFPAALEATIDDALTPLLKLIDLPESTRFFVDKETQAGEWYLDTLAVAPHAQGQGIGSQLLKALPELLRQKGESKMSLSVDLNNPDARRLYEKMGFEAADNLMIGAHEYTHMVKKLV